MELLLEGNKNTDNKNGVNFGLDPNVGPFKCTFYVARKKRFCKMSASKGKRFCGQHLVHDDQKDDMPRKRIICPLDPKHSCFEDKLTQHLSCCNAREKGDVPFLSKGLNEGEEAEPLPLRIKDLSDADLLAFIKKIEAVHEEFVEKIEESIHNHPALSDALKKPDYGLSVIRHLRQNSSLIGHLESKNLLQSDGTRVFVEFGAGRGLLTGWLIEAVKNNENSTFLLVDKASQRYKVDAKLKYNDKLNLKRIRIDIQDLDLNEVENLKSDCDLIACGKHLCGAATDFALRCLTRYEKGPIEGILIALCCHHKCSWKAYTGKQFFRKAGLSANDFPVLLSLSSWAVSRERLKKINTSDKEKLKNEENNTEYRENRYVRLGLSVLFREEIGRKAKQIIDMGRAEFLRRFNLNAKLIQYIDQSCTPENIALVALPNKSGDTICTQ